MAAPTSFLPILPFLLLLLLANAARALNQDGLHLLSAKRTLTVPPYALANWNTSDATPCGWTGVTCDAATGAVTGLSLPNVNLAGSFPAAALCRLPRLRSVDLSTNYIGTDLDPAPAGALARQQRLDLSMNLLVGPLPDALADLPDLRFLGLDSNNFSGPIPASFAQFKKLQSLSLVYNLLGLFANRLNGTLPADLGKNVPLVRLDVSDNAISGEIPPGVCDRGELKELLMLDNQLSGRIPDGLAHCRRLRRVRLSSNRLAGTMSVHLAESKWRPSWLSAPAALARRRRKGRRGRKEVGAAMVDVGSLVGAECEGEKQGRYFREFP